jgi:hypothetical protein
MVAADPVQRRAPPFDNAQGRLSRKEREKWGTQMCVFRARDYQPAVTCPFPTSQSPFLPTRCKMTEYFP